MSHKDKQFILWYIFPVFSQDRYQFLLIFFCYKQGITNFYFIKIALCSQNLFTHFVIFNCIHDMCRLYNHLFDTVFFHMFQGFLHTFNMHMISFFQLFSYHITGPCTINSICWIRFLQFIFNSVNCLLSGIVMTGTKTDYQNSLCLYRHLISPLHYILLKLIDIMGLFVFYDCINVSCFIIIEYTGRIFFRKIRATYCRLIP